MNKLDDKLKRSTSDQKKIVEYIEKNIDQQLLIFISGNGGSGKSYLLQIIYEILTLNCLTVRKLATTGNAAKLIEGEIVHSFFSINTENKCTLPYKSPKWHAIRSSDVIIIDEISMMSHELLTNINDVLNAIDTHNAVQNEKVKFGSKSIILVGDLLQLPAVSSTRLPITQLYKSILFKNYFIPFIMEINVRAIDDVEFAKFLSKCRVGSMNDDDFQYIKLRVCGIGHARTEECDKIYNSLSICSLHQKRKEIMINLLDSIYPNLSKIYIKANDIYENGSNVSQNMSDKISNSSGSFEETLILTKGCKIILIKNIDVQTGIANGLHGYYVDHSDTILLMSLENGELVPIRKMKQKIPALESYGTHVYRYQFPILLGYSVTVHRVQGATLQKTHLYLDKTMFCEGQAYVALFRTKYAKAIHIMNFDMSAFKTNMEIVELLEYAKLKKTMKNFTAKKNENVDKIMQKVMFF